MSTLAAQTGSGVFEGGSVHDTDETGGRFPAEIVRHARARRDCIVRGLPEL